MTTYKSKIYECDNPQCRKRVPEKEPGIEAAEGFHFGGILHIHPGGGDSFASDTYACSPNCLAPALVHAWERYKSGEDRD